MFAKGTSPSKGGCVEPEWTDPHYHILSHIKGTQEDYFLEHMRVIKLTKPKDASLIGGKSSYFMIPIKNNDRFEENIRM